VLKGILHKIAEDLGIPEDAARHGDKLEKLKCELDQRDDPHIIESDKDIIAGFERLLERNAQFEEYLRNNTDKV